MFRLPKEYLSNQFRRARLWLSRLNSRSPRLKYYIVTAIIVAYTLFIGDRNIVTYARLVLKERSLKESLDKYAPIYKADSARLEEFYLDPNNIERIAREQYYMSAPGEEVYLIPVSPKQK